MTRIAVVEWFPRLCGVVEWARHFTAGARSAGYTCDLITASKSGKWLKAWPESMRDEFIVKKYGDDLVDSLNGYDIIILSDIACWSSQIVSPRHPGVPAFIADLSRVNRPITAMYHGGTYPAKLDPTLIETVKLKAWTGVMLTTREPYARERLARVDGFENTEYISHPYLPIDFSRVSPAKIKRKRKALMMTARIAVNKGQNTAMYLAQRHGFNLEMWGYNSFGLPSIGFRLWELAHSMGLKPTTKKPALPRGCNNKNPNAYKFYTGSFEFAHGNGKRIIYNDAYTSLDEVDWSPVVHLSLPTAEFGGSLEYVSLEAVMRGSIAVVPEVALKLPRYAGRFKPAVTVPFTKASIWARDDLQSYTVRTKDDLDGIGIVLKDLLRMPLDELAGVNADHRALVEKHHDAKKVARKLIKELEKKL